MTYLPESFRNGKYSPETNFKTNGTLSNSRISESKNFYYEHKYSRIPQ
jgi:hypothetical protein